MKPGSATGLEPTARIFGRLLLHELDRETWAELARPEVAEALREVGVELPASLSDGELDQLAVEFLEAFDQPEAGGPLVQSLWTEGTYEGESAVAIRKLARFAGFDFDREAARRAPHDHLGCTLLLWAEVRTCAPEVARRLEEDHLAWALAPLARLGAGEGFYAGLARATGGLLREIRRSPD